MHTVKTCTSPENFSGCVSWVGTVASCSLQCFPVVLFIRRIQLKEEVHVNQHPGMLIAALHPRCKLESLPGAHGGPFFKRRQAESLPGRTLVCSAGRLSCMCSRDEPKEMRRRNILPNEITFTTVTCRHWHRRGLILEDRVVMIAGHLLFERVTEYQTTNSRGFRLLLRIDDYPLSRQQNWTHQPQASRMQHIRAERLWGRSIL